MIGLFHGFVGARGDNTGHTDLGSVTVYDVATHTKAIPGLLPAGLLSLAVGLLLVVRRRLGRGRMV